MRQITENKNLSPEEQGVIDTEASTVLINHDSGLGTWKSPFIDIADAILSFGKWYKLAQFTIKRRYYTTGLGPFWALITNAVFIFGISFLYSGAFDLRFQSYLIHLGLGYLIWSVISDTFGSGGNVFLAEYGIYSQLKVNKLGLILKGVLARTIIFMYNLPLLLFILYLINSLSFVMFASIAGFFILLVNSFFVSYSLSVLSARYRDVPHIIGTIIRFAFFFTPILWQTDAVGTGMRLLIVKLNPFYHFIEIVREPLKSQIIPWESWGVVGLCTVINVLLFYRFAHRNIVIYAT